MTPFRKTLVSLIPIVGVLTSALGALALGYFVYASFTWGSSDTPSLFDNRIQSILLISLPFLAALFALYFNAQLLMAIIGKIQLHSRDMSINRWITRVVTGIFALYVAWRVLLSGDTIEGRVLIQFTGLAIFSIALLGIGQFPYYLQKKYNLGLK